MKSFKNPLLACAAFALLSFIPQAHSADRVAHSFTHEEGSIVLSFYNDGVRENVIRDRAVTLSLKKDDLKVYSRDSERCSREVDCWTAGFEEKRRDKRSMKEVLELKHGKAAATKMEELKRALTVILSFEDQRNSAEGLDRIYVDKQPAKLVASHVYGIPAAGKSMSISIADDCKTHVMLRELFVADGVSASNKSYVFNTTRLLHSQNAARNAIYARSLETVKKHVIDFVESEFPEKLH